MDPIRKPYGLLDTCILTPVVNKIVWAMGRPKAEHMQSFHYLGRFHAFAVESYRQIALQMTTYRLYNYHVLIFPSCYLPLSTSCWILFLYHLMNYLLCYFMNINWNIVFDRFIYGYFNVLIQSLGRYGLSQEYAKKPMVMDLNHR